MDSALCKQEAGNYIEKQRYELIVLDVNLPDGNGFDFCKEVKERCPETAVIFLTANDHFYDLIADGFEEKQREIYLKKMLDPGRYPYYMGKNQVKLYEGYMDGILMLHGISNRQYDELSPEKRKAFQIDIERAVGAVIEKYLSLIHI